MSLRQIFPGGIVKPGFNPLGAQTSTTQATLYSWGFNNHGQLGLNNLTSFSSPNQVGALTDWLTVACGYYHNVAIKNNGTLWTWGWNAVCQLGLGNTTLAMIVA